MIQALVANVHLVATLMMAGLIWFVQVVHYPMLAAPGGRGFAGKAREHQRRTSYVVVPLMLAELGTAVLLVPLSPDGARALPAAGLALLAVVWGSTALLQVPCHKALARGYDARAAGRLVATNWIRTIGWSARVPVAVALAVG